MILCSNPHAQYLAHKNEIDKAIAKVLDDGWYVLGKEVRAFEEEFAKYLGINYCLGVGSGTEALHLALAACGITAGDEVITVSHTAVATVAAIVQSGAKPIFADVDIDTYTMDPKSLIDAISPRTKAIIPVHLYGQAAPMKEICSLAKQHNLFVIEDCAQATGAILDSRRLGTYGHLGCFSFYPTKNLGALGDGGAVVTADQELAERVRLLRQYGWKERFVSEIPGWNSRLDELQAAVLRVKLAYLDHDNLLRQQLAEQYHSQLVHSDLILPKVREGADHVYHLFVIRTLQRNKLLDFLRTNGVSANIHYPVPVHKQPAYILCGKSLPVTEKIVEEILTLPLYPELKQEEVKKVINGIWRYIQ